MSSELILNVSRDNLCSKIVFKVANEAMEDYMTADVQVDVNLRPATTYIPGDQEEVKEGDLISIVQW